MSIGHVLSNVFFPSGSKPAFPTLLLERPGTEYQYSEAMFTCPIHIEKDYSNSPNTKLKSHTK